MFAHRGEGSLMEKRSRNHRRYVDREEIVDQTAALPHREKATDRGGAEDALPAKGRLPIKGHRRRTQTLIGSASAVRLCIPGSRRVKLETRKDARRVRGTGPSRERRP